MSKSAREADTVLSWREVAIAVIVFLMIVLVGQELLAVTLDQL